MTRDEEIEQDAALTRDIVKAFQIGLAFGFAKKYDEMDEVMEEVKKAATPKPKMGHWVELDENSAICSCCYKNNTQYGYFCKWCGAKMVDLQTESEVKE